MTFHIDHTRSIEPLERTDLFLVTAKVEQSKVAVSNVNQRLCEQLDLDQSSLLSVIETRTQSLDFLYQTLHADGSGQDQTSQEVIVQFDLPHPHKNIAVTLISYGQLDRYFLVMTPRQVYPEQAIFWLKMHDIRSKG